MSNWTHISGVVRFDGLNLPHFPVPDLGNNVPCGSEGGLTTVLWTNPDNGTMARYTTTIFGDLRDYDDAEEIVRYFDRITKDIPVRGGAVSIETHLGATHLYWDVDLDKWERAKQ